MLEVDCQVVGAYHYIEVECCALEAGIDWAGKVGENVHQKIEAVHFEEGQFEYASTGHSENAEVHSPSEVEDHCEIGEAHFGTAESLD